MFHELSRRRQSVNAPNAFFSFYRFSVIFKLFSNVLSQFIINLELPTRLAYFMATIYFENASGSISDAALFKIFPALSAILRTAAEF